MQRIQSRRFTLLELLAVIAIITLLVGMIVGGVSAGMRKASEAKTRGRLHQLELALDQYRRDWGYHPVSAGTLCSQSVAPCTDATISVVRWDDAYFCNQSGKKYLEEYPVDADNTNNNVFNDGFDSPFYYRCPGKRNPQSYDLWSTGADGLFGTAKTTDPNKSLDLTDITDNDDITNWKRQ